MFLVLKIDCIIFTRISLINQYDQFWENREITFLVSFLLDDLLGRLFRIGETVVVSEFTLFKKSSEGSIICDLEKLSGNVTNW